MNKVRTQQAWHAAVRHTGLLFQLPLLDRNNIVAAAAAAIEIEDAEFESAQKRLGKAKPPPAKAAAKAKERAAQAEAYRQYVTALPYPQLARPISGPNFVPMSHIAEHYSPPGGETHQCIHPFTHGFIDHMLAMSKHCSPPGGEA